MGGDFWRRGTVAATAGLLLLAVAAWNVAQSTLTRHRASQTTTGETISVTVPETTYFCKP